MAPKKVHLSIDEEAYRCTEPHPELLTFSPVDFTTGERIHHCSQI